MSFDHLDNLLDLGIEINPNLEIRKSCNAGNGLFFKENVDIKEIKNPLVKIPKSLVITQQKVFDAAKSNPFLDDLLRRSNIGEPNSSTPPNPRQSIARFIVYLILSSRRGTPDKQFDFWLKTLPPGKDIDLPFTWPDDDLDELERSSIFDAIFAKKTNLKLSYEDFFSNLEFRKEIAAFVNSGVNKNLRPIDSEVSYHDWQLIEEWILSRSLSLPRRAGSKVDKEENDSKDEDKKEGVEGEEGEKDDSETIFDLALVPIIDICNHSHNANARYEVNSNGDVLLLLQDDIKELPEDLQITISYGSDKSAGEFLFTYGFIPDIYKNSKALTRFYSVEDTNIEKLLDLDNYSQNDDRIPYTFLTKFLDRPVNRFSISYPLPDSPFPRWHDDLIYLLACEGSLLVHKDEQAGYLELYYDNYEVDLNDVENFLIAVDRKKFLTEIVPRADKIAEKILNSILELIREGGEIGSPAGQTRTTNHELIDLEKKLIEETLKGIENHKDELKRINEELEKVSIDS